MIFTRPARRQFLILSLLLTACAGTTPAVRKTASVDRGPQKLMGFNFREENDEAQRFRFRDQGDFLISQNTFTRRKDAVEFCRAHPEFTLADWQFPEAMAVMSLPFEDLKKNHVIDEKVLGEENRNGVAFWVKGKTTEEEESFNKAPDLVYEMLNDCGPGCGYVEPLSTINERLQKLGKSPRALQAICLSDELKKSVGQ